MVSIYLKKKHTQVFYQDKISAFIFTHLEIKETSHTRDQGPEKAILTGKATKKPTVNGKLSVFTIFIRRLPLVGVIIIMPAKGGSQVK